MTTRATHRARNARRMQAILALAGLAVIAFILYIAFTVNSGLPGEDRYEVRVAVPDANRVIKDAEVRIGGINVGRVKDVAAVRPTNGDRPYARVELSLDASVPPLPEDSRVRVRPASTLGLTYVEVRRGTSSDTVRSGGVLPVEQSEQTVDLTDLFGIFDHRTRRAFRAGTSDASDGVIGRGLALNATFGNTNHLLPALTDVTRTLADDQTRLGPFIAAFDTTVSALAPVDEQLAGAVASGAVTFDALAGVRDAIGAGIDVAPPAETAATRALSRVRPALDGLSRLATDLLPGVRVLPSALDSINQTLPAANPAFRLLPGFSENLQTTLADIGTVVRDPATRGALRKAPGLLKAIDSFLGPLAAAEVNCNLLPLWGENFGSYPNAYGTGAGPAIGNVGLTHLGAERESLQNKEPSRDAAINYLPNMNAQECESGNEPYDGSQVLNNPPTLQSKMVPATAPPMEATAHAQAAGLLDDPEGAP